MEIGSTLSFGLESETGAEIGSTLSDGWESETGVVWGWVRGERIGSGLGRPSVATALTWLGMTSIFRLDP